MTGGRPLSFSRLISGGNRSPRLVGGMRSPAYISGTQISRRKDQAGSLGSEEKTSRTRDIHSKAFTPGVLCRFLIAGCLLNRNISRATVEDYGKEKALEGARNKGSFSS